MPEPALSHLGSALAWPGLPYVGLAALLVGAFAFLWVFSAMFERAWRRVSARLYNRGSASAGAGFTILVAASGRERDLIEEILTEHLPRYSFGAPVQIMRRTALEARSPEEARLRAERALDRSRADLLVRAGVGTAGTEAAFGLHTVIRDPGPAQSRPRHGFNALPPKRRDWSEGMKAALGYQLAKRLQPAIGRPEAFRPERVSGLAEQLETLRRADGVPESLRPVISADFRAAALHLASEGKERRWIPEVIEDARDALSGADGGTASPEAAQTRIDLGRALLSEVADRYDEDKISEAMKQLDVAVEILKAQPTLRQASRATDAINNARGLLQTRRRFAVNFSG